MSSEFQAYSIAESDVNEEKHLSPWPLAFGSWLLDKTCRLKLCMRLKTQILALVLVASTAASAGDDFKSELKRQCEKHLMVLRSPFQPGDQEFDSSGKPLKDPPGGQWRTYGPIFVQKLKIDSHRLRLEGPRVAFGADEKMVPLGKSIHVNIQLDHRLNSLSDGLEALNRVFFTDAKTSDYPRPTFLRPDEAILPDETIYQVKEGNHVQAPVAKYQPDADYPETARRKRREGQVTLSLVLDDAGTVSRVILEKVAGFGFDEACVERVKTWRFAPATLDGRPVAVRVSVETEFHLY
jgi:TonB family protein